MSRESYRNYLLTVLGVILAFNYVDRLALGLVAQEIKVSFGLSDTQLGLLTGIAFAMFYSLMGIPLARWADKGNRVAIISITTLLWSIAVALSGLAQSFLALLSIRVGVAVGEAGCMPPAHSLIADHFTRAERPRAVARYLVGAPLSAAIGYFVAGWLNQFFGWRVMFAALGLPGLALAALAWLTLREPRLVVRSEKFRDSPSPAASGSSQDLPTLKLVCLTLAGNRTFRHLLLGYTVMGLFTNGMAQWLPAFFIRSYGLHSGELGNWFAAIMGLGGMLGTYLGGELAVSYAQNNERLQLRTMALAFASFGLSSSIVYLSSNHYLAFAMMALAIITGAATNGPLFATIQTLVPQRMRAMSIAIVYFFVNLIGLGLGPLAVGALSDALRPILGEESLRYALLATCPGYLWAAWHLWRAGDTVTMDLQTSCLDHESGRRSGEELLVSKGRQ